MADWRAMEAALASTTTPAMLGGVTGLAAPSSRRLSPRAAVLWEIAERFDSLMDPSNGGSGVRGDGSWMPALRHEPGCVFRSSSPPRCSCSLRSVVEFSRLVSRLRVEERELWRHLDGWWLSATTRTVWHCPRCGICHQKEHVHSKRKGSGLLVVKCKRVVAWSRLPGAQKSRALDAVEVLASWWGLEHEPMLPRDLRLIG